MHIFHITDQSTWREAKHGTLYEGDTLSIDGFIHCCLVEQIEGVLLNWFKGKRDLVILEIDPEILLSPMKYENLEGGVEVFPHVYGPINLDAVVNEEPVKRGEKSMHQLLEKIPIKKLKIRAFDLWDTNWLLLTSGDFSKGNYNAMTVAWGSIGNMWNIPIAMIVVRPTRYTYGFINTYPTFSLCGFPEEYRKALNLLGTKSGRDGDKISEARLTPTASEKIEAPTYKEADLSIECRKIYFHDFNPGHFLDERIEKHYALKDYHRMIFGEILMVKGNADQYSEK